MKIKNFHVGVKAVIIQNNKALVLEENSKRNTFSLPGGKVDEGEGIDQGLKRELKEEIGLTEYKKGPLLHAFERTDYGKKNAGLLILVYLVEANISNIRLSYEHKGFKWVGKKDLSWFNKNDNHLNKDLKAVLENLLK
jgi:mutator protein MutT